MLMCCWLLKDIFHLKKYHILERMNGELCITGKNELTKCYIVCNMEVVLKSEVLA